MELQNPVPGCQACKEVIDNRAALIRQMDCMSTSILLAAAAGGPQPTPAMAEEFKNRAEDLVKCAAAIERHVNPPRNINSLSGTTNPSGGAS